MGRRERAFSTWLNAGVNFAVVKGFSTLTGSNDERQEETKKKGYRNTRFDGKLLTPNCSNFPCIEMFLYLCQGVVEVDLSVAL